MADEKWVKRNDLKPIVESLIKTYPVLKYINPEKMGYCSFSQKKSKAAAKIARVSKMCGLFMCEVYVLCVHKEYWDNASEGDKLYVILHELKHIPEGGFDEISDNYKKLLDHDIQDFYRLLKEFGIDREHLDKLVEAVREHNTFSIDDEKVKVDVTTGEVLTH